MTNVVQIGEFQFSRKKRDYMDKGCKHHRTTLSSDGEITMCDDCGKQVSSYWVLLQVLDAYTEQVNKLHRERVAVSEVAGKQLHLKAAQDVERAWRSKSMVPVCPHCREAIFPQDLFGRSMTNREMALRRRAVKADASEIHIPKS